jgi:hypothetical protein
MDFQVIVTDIFGTRIDGASVSVSASGGGRSWSGFLTGVGNGVYRICNQGSFNAPASGVTINASASKTGYATDTGTGIAQVGDLTGCF